MSLLPLGLLFMVEDSLTWDGLTVQVRSEPRLRATIHRLVEVSSLEKGERAAWARFLVRGASQSLGILPASIDGLYRARARGDVPATWTTPAFNLRVLPFEAARAVFRAARRLDAGAFIFEIARVELDWTGQSLAEYATAVLAAAIAEGYRGAVFLQGDHFQASAKRARWEEKTALEALIREAVLAGFFNLDLDASTLVDLSHDRVLDQQFDNAILTASLVAFARSFQPEGISFSLGGEIGEVGGHVTTEEELHAFMHLFQRGLHALAGDLAGLSKVSIHTGSAHGGIVLPDGSFAPVNIAFDAIQRLGEVARQSYGMGGVVQHGASTLPLEYFPAFVRYGTLEVHLATAFMNTFFEHLPEEYLKAVQAWLDARYQHERRAEQSDAQFYAGVRMHALAPFKETFLRLPEEIRQAVMQDWETQFVDLMERLGCAGTRALVERWVNPRPVPFYLEDYWLEASKPAGESDLSG